MNKQQYLAELQRLLVFMTEEDRELTIRRYGEIFDAAGPEGEEAAAAELGTPTKAAIGLSRGYEPGSVESHLPPVPAPPEPEPEPEPPEAKEPNPWGDIPDYEPPETPLPRQQTAPPAQKAPAAPPEQPKPAKPAAPARPEEREEDWPDLPSRGDLIPEIVYERSVPLGLGIPLFLLLTLALGFPLFLICLGITAVFLAPGAALLLGAYLIFVGGLWCLSVVADAILLFGAAMVVLALSLFVLRIGLWLSVQVWKLWGRGMIWMGGELLGRRVTTYE